MGQHTPAAAGIVQSVQVGRVAPLGPDGVPSGFLKQEVAGAIEVGYLGLAGDEQADLRVHGGADKALYGYAQAHYRIWQEKFPEHLALLAPGGFGENLTLAQCDERTVCIADVVRMGTVLLQVTQPRQPCFKFALRFGDTRMPREMIRNGLCGWYYRVRERGRLGSGDEVTLLERPCPQWSIDRVNRRVVQRRADPAERADFERDVNAAGQATP